MKDLKDGYTTQNLQKTLDIGFSEKNSKAISERIQN